MRKPRPKAPAVREAVNWHRRRHRRALRYVSFRNNTLISSSRPRAVLARPVSTCARRHMQRTAMSSDDERIMWRRCEILASGDQRRRQSGSVVDGMPRAMASRAESREPQHADQSCRPTLPRHGHAAPLDLRSRTHSFWRFLETHPATLSPAGRSFIPLS